MWCKSCQQDVPGLPLDERGSYACPRCGESFVLDRPQPVEMPIAAAATVVRPRSSRLALVSGTRMPALYDDWEVDEQLRHIGRVLAVDSDEATEPKLITRIDDAHTPAPAPHQRPDWTGRVGGMLRKVETVQSQGILPALTWLAMLLGTMAIVCGGVLVAWSWLGERPELWRIGQPVALGGVCSLVLGLALQLDRHWQERRTARADEG
jgi:hypothetical protein